MEFKYRAVVDVEEFNKFCDVIFGECKSYTVFGEDKFFFDPSKPDTFYRYRTDNNHTSQMTFKRKTTSDNNYIREEHNIDLAPTCTYEQIADLLESQGYKYNTSVHKISFVHVYESFVLSYYLVMDKNLNHLDKFIEIEMREDIAWKNEKEPWYMLVTLEKLCKTIGISEESRQSKSLFEMYKE